MNNHFSLHSLRSHPALPFLVALVLVFVGTIALAFGVIAIVSERDRYSSGLEAENTLRRARERTLSDRRALLLSRPDQDRLSEITYTSSDDDAVRLVSVVERVAQDAGVSIKITQARFDGTPVVFHVEFRAEGGVAGLAQFLHLLEVHPSGISFERFSLNASEQPSRLSAHSVWSLDGSLNVRSVAPTPSSAQDQ